MGEKIQIGVDLVGKLDHRRLDDALGKLADLQGQVLRRELEVDSSPILRPFKRSII